MLVTYLGIPWRLDIGDAATLSSARMLTLLEEDRVDAAVGSTYQLTIPSRSLLADTGVVTIPGHELAFLVIRVRHGAKETVVELERRRWRH